MSQAVLLPAIICITSCAANISCIGFAGDASDKEMNIIFPVWAITGLLSMVMFIAAVK